MTSDRAFYEKQLRNAQVRLRAAQQDVEQATRRLQLATFAPPPCGLAPASSEGDRE